MAMHLLPGSLFCFSLPYPSATSATFTPKPIIIYRLAAEVETSSGLRAKTVVPGTFKNAALFSFIGAFDHKEHPPSPASTPKASASNPPAHTIFLVSRSSSRFFLPTEFSSFINNPQRCPKGNDFDHRIVLTINPLHSFHLPTLLDSTLRNLFHSPFLQGLERPQS